MKFTSSIFLLIVVLVFSCSEEKKVRASIKKSTPSFEKQLLNPVFFNEENFKNVSFPIWFNKERVKEKGLEEISLSYHSYKFLPNTPSAELTKRPKKVRTFKFDTEGWVKTYTIKEYYDEKLISTSQFRYKNSPDSLGYSLPIVDINQEESSNLPLLLIQSLKELLVYDRLEKIESDSKIINFQETFYVNSHAVQYIVDKESQNITFINDKIEPSIEDIIVYGTPSYPQKSFSVKNKIEIDDIYEHTYFENNVIKSSILNMGVFSIKRDYSFSPKGIYFGYSDSTFAQSELIQVDNTSIYIDSLEIPYQIINTIAQSNGFEQEKSAILVTFTKKD